MSLALATLLYEWRRYMAAVVALAFSGMMVLVMLGHPDVKIYDASLSEWAKDPTLPMEVG